MFSHIHTSSLLSRAVYVAGVCVYVSARARACPERDARHGHENATFVFKALAYFQSLFQVREKCNKLRCRLCLTFLIGKSSSPLLQNVATP